MLPRVYNWAQTVIKPAAQNYIPINAGEWSAATKGCVNTDGSTFPGPVPRIYGSEPVEECEWVLLLVS